MGDWNGAVTQLEEAVRRDPGLSLTHQQLALALSNQAEQGFPEQIPQAIEEFKKAIALEPAWAANHANLGALYLAQGDLVSAREQYTQAATLAPEGSLYQFNLGLLCEQVGDQLCAANAYMSTLDHLYQRSTLDFWQQTPLREKVYAFWLYENPEKPVMLTDALELLAKNDDYTSIYNLVAQAYLDEGETAKAQVSVSYARLAYAGKPFQSLDTQWLQAEIFAQEGYPDQAKATAQPVIDQYALPGLDGPGSFGALQYAPRIFHSLAMSLEVVPQLQTLPLSQHYEEMETTLASW